MVSCRRLNQTNTTMPINNRLDKITELVHYVCSRVDPGKLGATRLNKILFYAERAYFRKNLEPISGAAYVKDQYGPRLQVMPRVIEQLIQEGRLQTEMRQKYDYQQEYYFAKGDTDISKFSDEELHIVDKVAQLISEGHSAKSISEESHDESWQAARHGEEIPMFTALGQFEEPTEDDFKWARDMIAEHR